MNTRMMWGAAGTFCIVQLRSKDDLGQQQEHADPCHQAPRRLLQASDTFAVSLGVLRGRLRGERRPLARSWAMRRCRQVAICSVDSLPASAKMLASLTVFQKRVRCDQVGGSPARIIRGVIVRRDAAKTWFHVPLEHDLAISRPDKAGASER